MCGCDLFVGKGFKSLFHLFCYDKAIHVLLGSGLLRFIVGPESGVLFVAVRQGILHIFHEENPNKFDTVESVKTEFGARNIVLDPESRRLYLSSDDFAAGQATADQPNPQPTPIAGTLRLLVYGR